MKKKSLSVVITFISFIVIAIAIIIVLLLFILNARSTLLNNLKQNAEITIEALSKSIYVNLSQSMEMANNAAKIAETVTDPPLLKDALKGLLGTNTNAFELY